MNKFKAVFKRKGTIIWAAISAFLLALFITLTVLENTLLYPILSTVLGGPMPIMSDDAVEIYKSDYDSKADSKAAGDELNVRIAEEGFTLLLNENGALPIATPESDKNVSVKPKVSVFGKNSVDLVLGGSGSGGIGGENAATIYDGLEKGGFEYNPTLKKFYDDNGASGNGRSASPELTEGSSEAPTLDIGETPVSKYTAAVRGSFQDYHDAAIVVISRMGGESWDLPRSQNVKNGGIDGNHYLQLDKNEYEMLDMVTARFDKVIVVLNTLTAFQCDFIDEYNNTETDKRIDAVLWIGGPGTTGAKAFGDVLSGKVNPSGKTVDIYSRDFTKDPTWQNFGDNSQVNDGANGSAFLENGSPLAGNYMVAYEEGVYMGYRYYETRAFVEKSNNADWYEENVIFPFGHGLTYTSFTQEIVEVSGELADKDSELTIKVRVKNTGSRAGKDVVQLYVTKPYYNGGIEKSHVELVDFAKTPLLATEGENSTCEVTFKVDAYSLASYDYNDANGNGISGYELEHGDYKFIISANSHTEKYAYDSETVSLASDLYFEYSTVDPEVKVENRFTTDDFNDVQYRLLDVTSSAYKGARKGMSRTDFAGTFPKAPTKEERELIMLDDGSSERAALRDRGHNNPWIGDVTTPPTTGKTENTVEVKDENGNVTKRPIILRDLVDENGIADFDDPRWEILLDRLTFDEMLDLVNNGAFQTSAIMSIKKNLTNDSDGPIGFVNFMPGKSSSYVGNTTFACEIVIGSTWNKDLAYRMGKIVGENGLWGDVNGNHLPYSGWYAPAVNLHRSPFSGRNFEYYSEDPVLSGKLAVNVVNGAMTKGVYTDLKHFALNDQETNRSGIATYCTEQALRELYLKPFEIAVKGLDDPDAVATAKADGIKQFRGTTGIMSSFNRIGTRWTGGDYRLMTQILRDEWGFRGLAICDYKTDNSFMDSRQMLYAGNDLILASLTNLMWTDASASSAQDVTVLRTAAKNILYTVANSNSVNVDIVGYRMEWWRILTIAVDCLVAVGIGVWGFFAIRGALKKASATENASAASDESKTDNE